MGGSLFEEIIYYLLQYRRASALSTKIFSQLAHNADLCPKFQYKLELIHSSFKKYQQITYDIQGFRDRGSDVIVRQPLGDENNFICLQIKSDTDLRAKDYMTKLKAQSFETQITYKNLIDYYIILCCNIIDNKIGKKPSINIERKNQIRAIEAEFATSKNIHVIEPEYAITFLQLSALQIDAAIKSKLASEDIVFRNALVLLTELSPSEKVLIFHLIILKIYQNKNEVSVPDILDNSYIEEFYNLIPDYKREWFFIDESLDSDGYPWYTKKEIRVMEKSRNLSFVTRIAEDLDHLEGNLIDRNINGNYEINLEILQPLVILMMDGNLRYNYSNEELIKYMMSLFLPMKGYVPQEESL